MSYYMYSCSCNWFHDHVFCSSVYRIQLHLGAVALSYSTLYGTTQLANSRVASSKQGRTEVALLDDTRQPQAGLQLYCVELMFSVCSTVRSYSCSL